MIPTSYLIFVVTGSNRNCFDPPLFGTFPKIHPIWKCAPSLTNFREFQTAIQMFKLCVSILNALIDDTFEKTSVFPNT